MHLLDFIVNKTNCKCHDFMPSFYATIIYYFCLEHIRAIHSWFKMFFMHSQHHFIQFKNEIVICKYHQEVNRLTALLCLFQFSKIEIRTFISYFNCNCCQIIISQTLVLLISLKWNILDVCKHDFLQILYNICHFTSNLRIYGKINLQIIYLR